MPESFDPDRVPMRRVAGSVAGSAALAATLLHAPLAPDGGWQLLPRREDAPYVVASTVLAIETPPCASQEAAVRLASVAHALADGASRAAALLDRVMPGWAALVSPATLDMERLDGCPLTMLFGSYRRGLRVLGLSATDEDEAERLGLTISSATFEAVWPHSAWLWTWMTQLWRGLVVERRVSLPRAA